MPRKTAIQNDANVVEALGEWKALTEVRYELAKEAYDFQDDETKALLDRIVNRLRVGASGYITVRVNGKHGSTVPVKIEQQYLDFNLLYVATEILKDLALFDIRVGTYEIPPSHCVLCAAEIVKEQPKKRRRV
jgi:copper chaperone CopZ